MDRYAGISRRLGALVATGALIALGACSPESGAPGEAGMSPGGGATAATPPPGFTVERAGPVALARPDDWNPGNDLPGTVDAALALTAPGAAGAYPPLLAVYVEEGFEGTIKDYRFTFNAESSTAVPGREIVEESSATVPGAESALVIEAEYPIPADEDVLIRQLDLLVVGPDGATADVRASARVEDFDSLRSTFMRVLDSVVFEDPGTDA